MPSPLHSDSAHRAYQRIDALLRAYGIRNAAVRANVSQRILEESMAASPSENALEAVGARLTLDKVEAAIRTVLPTVTETPDRTGEKKLYLALQRTRLPEARPDCLLGEGTPTPDELARLKDAFALQRTPALRRQSMGAPTLRFEGIEEVASGTTALFVRWPRLGTLAKITGIALLTLLVYQFAK